VTSGQQNPTPDQVPRGPIVIALVLTAMSVTGVVFNGVNLFVDNGGRGNTVLFVFSILMTLIWAVITVALMGKRRHRVTTPEEFKAMTRAANTGIWGPIGGQPGTVLTVRWDPELRLHYVEGWVAEHWQIAGERVWPDWATLRNVIRDAERAGLAPHQDDGTRIVRARLIAADDPIQNLGIHPRTDRA
jgi:hypothetical protein